MVTRTGIDVRDFIKLREVTGLWDVIVFDPPYWDESLLPKNGGTVKYKDSKTMRSDHQAKRFMSPLERLEILKELILRSSNKLTILGFYNAPQNPLDISSIFSFLKYSCQHVWVRPIKYSMTGSTERNNGEYITIYSNHKFPRAHTKGFTLSKYLVHRPPEKRTASGEHIARTAAKPLKLYKELFKHVDAKHVLDPFAGYGESILAAKELGIQIDACDIDPTINWNVPLDVMSWFE